MLLAQFWLILTEYPYSLWFISSLAAVFTCKSALAFSSCLIRYVIVSFALSHFLSGKEPFHLNLRGFYSFFFLVLIMSFPHRNSNIVSVGWSSVNMYSTQPNVKHILETLALRALRYLEIQTGFCFEFTHMAIAYDFIIFFFISINLHYPSSSLHRHPGDILRHLTVRYYFGDFLEISTIHILFSFYIYLDSDIKLGCRNDALL